MAHALFNFRLHAVLAFAGLFGSQTAVADPCAGIQGDAQYLKDSIETTIREIDRALYFQRSEASESLQFQVQCDNREEKSAACRDLGISLEVLVYLRKEKEQVIRDLTQKLSYHRQEYQSTNLKLFRCRQQYGSAESPPAVRLSDDDMFRIRQENKEREKYFQPPSVEPPPYDPDIDLRQPNSLGDPSVRGPKRSREPGKATRLVPGKPGLPEGGPDDMADLPNFGTDESAALPGFDKDELAGSQFPSPEDWTPEQRERWGKLLEEEQARIEAQMPPLPNFGTDEAKHDKPAERIVTLPSGFPSPDDWTPEQRERWGKLLEEEQARIEAQMPPLPNFGTDEAKHDKPPERIVTLPGGLPSPQSMTPEQQEQLSAALQQELPQPSVVPQEVAPPVTPGPGLPYTCSTDAEGSFPCDVVSTDSEGNFEITSPGKPSYSFAYIEPNVFSVFWGSTNLPGLYRRTEIGGKVCWINDATPSSICMQ
ncbi:MAG: hypothetical protein IPM06_06750 [Rhizobiales bacterium]|nr:hypothetical protein [Hyphomicrobiales bacterium]